MKRTNWMNVTASTDNGGKLPAGAYELMIVEVNDNEAKEYLEIVWDVAAGEHKGHFADEFGRNNAWAHMFRVSYADRAAGLFKRFLDCIEKSNPSFSIEQWQTTSNPQAFVGKYFGAAWGTEKYTNAKGEDKERATFPNYYSLEDIRNGNYTVPKDKDSRNQTAQQPTQAVDAYTSVYDQDIPF